MPNWCQNSLTLTAGKKMSDPEKYLKWFEDTGFDFHKICPLPKPRDIDLNNMMTSGYNVDLANHLWGTKWPVHECEESFHFSRSGDTFHVSFDSAWSAPDQIYNILSAMGFEFTALYIEEGMSQYGMYKNNPQFPAWQAINKQYDFPTKKEMHDDEFWETHEYWSNWPWVQEMYLDNLEEGASASESESDE